jgi:hypothetical protein
LQVLESTVCSDELLCWACKLRFSCAFWAFGDSLKPGWHVDFCGKEVAVAEVVNILSNYWVPFGR